MRARSWVAQTLFFAMILSCFGGGYYAGMPRGASSGASAGSAVTSLLAMSGTHNALPDANAASQLATAASSTNAPPAVALRRIAIGTRGTADKLAVWAVWLAALPAAVRDDVSIFFSAHAGDLSSGPARDAARSMGGALASALSEPAATWAGRRNLLAEAMFVEEVRRGGRFDYWVFSDGDVLPNWECRGCPTGVVGAACCATYVFGHVLTAYSFASVAAQLLPHEQQWGEARDWKEPASFDAFVFRDCADCLFKAFHRDAVPIVLPYITDMDAQSWWGSQAMLFHFTRGCLAGGNVLPLRHMRPVAHAMEHSSYPQGRNQPQEAAVAAAAFPALAPDIISFAVYKDDACESPRTLDEAAVRTFSRADAAGHASPRAGRRAPFRHQGWLGEWNATAQFAKCLAVRSPHFIKTVGRGAAEAPRR